MQTPDLQSRQFVRRAISGLLAALLALTAVGIVMTEAGATSFAIIDEEAQEQVSDDPLKMLLNSSEGTLTSDDIRFFEQNLLLPESTGGVIAEQESSFDRDDQLTQEKSPLVDLWSEDPLAAH